MNPPLQKHRWILVSEVSQKLLRKWQRMGLAVSVELQHLCPREVSNIDQLSYDLLFLDESSTDYPVEILAKAGKKLVMMNSQRILNDPQDLFFEGEWPFAMTSYLSSGFAQEGFLFAWGGVCRSRQDEIGVVEFVERARQEFQFGANLPTEGLRLLAEEPLAKLTWHADHNLEGLSFCCEVNRASWVQSIGRSGFFDKCVGIKFQDRISVQLAWSRTTKEPAAWRGLLLLNGDETMGVEEQFSAETVAKGGAREA